MKLFNLIALLLICTSTFATSTRSTCENAYYATGYVKIHEYKVIIDWSYVSDYAHERLDDLLHGNHFEIISDNDLNWPLNIVTIKETNTLDPIDYEIILEELKTIPSKVNCSYAL